MVWYLDYGQEFLQKRLVRLLPSNLVQHRAPAQRRKLLGRPEHQRIEFAREKVDIRFPWTLGARFKNEDKYQGLFFIQTQTKSALAIP